MFHVFFKLSFLCVDADCFRLLPRLVLGTTLWWVPPCAGYHFVVGTTLRWVAPCAEYHHVVGSTLWWVAPCGGYHLVVGTTLYYPVLISCLEFKKLTSLFYKTR